MKRLIGYITLCSSILIGAVAGFIPAVLSINPSVEYGNGQKMVFKIEEKDGSSKTQGDIDDGNAIKEVTDLFKERLNKVNVSTYDLESEGNDVITITLKNEAIINKEISEYLSFDWNIEVSDFSGSVVLGEDTFFERGTAYIDYEDNYPVIIMPIVNPEDFKNKLLVNVGSGADSSVNPAEVNKGKTITTMEKTIRLFEDEDSEEESAKDTDFIYLVNNWSSEYSLDTVINNPSSALTEENNAYFDKILATDQTYSLFDDYDPESENAFTKLRYTTFLQNAGSDLSLANKLAVVTCAKLNASELNYKITLINDAALNTAENTTLPLIERLVNRGDNYGSFLSIAGSTLLYAFCFALVVVTVFAFLNYGLNALSSTTTTLSTVLLTLAIFNIFGAEFNLGSIIGLIGVAAISILSAIVYFRTVKEESYKGRNLKKANEEASSKTIAKQLDFSVITILLGIVCYLIPNSITVSIGIMFVVGSVMNLVLNGVLLRLLMYFLCNSSVINDNLKIIQIEKRLIPDVTKDEKPTYFEQFKKNRDPKVKNLPTKLGIAGVVLLVASVVGMLTFGILNGNIYRQSEAYNSTKVYIQFNYNENSNIQDVSDLEEYVLSNIYTYSNNTTTTTNLKYNNVDRFTHTYKISSVGNTSIEEIYYVVDFVSSVTPDTKVSASADNGKYLVENISVEEAINYLASDYASCSNLNEVSLKQVKNVNNDSNNFHSMVFGLIGCGLIFLYFILRFGISRALSALIIVGGDLTITTGIFTLIRGTFSSNITFGVVFLALFGFIVLANIFANEKDSYKENKAKLNTLTLRKENSKASIKLSFANVVVAFELISLMVISFLYAKAFSIAAIAFILVGLALLFVYSRFCLLDLSYALIDVFNKIRDWFKAVYANNKKDVKKVAKKELSDGPEEAIFIGIND